MSEFSPFNDIVNRACQQYNYQEQIANRRDVLRDIDPAYLDAIETAERELGFDFDDAEHLVSLMIAEQNPLPQMPKPEYRNILDRIITEIYILFDWRIREWIEDGFHFLQDEPVWKIQEWIAETEYKLWKKWRW